MSRMTNVVEQIKFHLTTIVQVCKVMTGKGKMLTKGDIIFTMINGQGQRQSFRSSITGYVTELFIRELDILSYNSTILEYEESRHSMIISTLCSECGINVKDLKSISSRLNSLETTLSTVPSLPKVTITRQAVLKFQTEENDYLLRKRKLHLLVDLDQTLVHTTNCEFHGPFSSDVVTYQLNHPTPQTFSTKLRPGVKIFLAHLRPLFQFHIVTLSDRPYAYTMAKLLDPDGTLFSDRIISRDDSVSSTDKSIHLTDLFPCDQSLVCIIDDREDVWNYASNVIRVKPYVWFKDHSVFNEAVDNDLYLSRLEVILKRIHSAFYNIYDQQIPKKQKLPLHLNQIMPEIRRQILRSVSLCFSHFMPENYPLEKHQATIMAQAMGAKVTHDFKFDANGTIQTTHLIAGQYTMKVHQALQHQVKVVTPEWLIDCYEEWEKQTEENYSLTSDYDVTKSRLFTEEIPRISKRKYRDMEEQVSVISQTFSSQVTMDKRRDLSKNTNDLSSNLSLEESPTNGNNCFDTVSKANELDGQSCRSKRQCIVRAVDTKQENRSDEELEDCESDSSSIGNLRDLDLDKENGYSSEEEDLDGDQAPLGWIKACEQERYCSAFSSTFHNPSSVLNKYTFNFYAHCFRSVGHRDT